MKLAILIIGEQNSGKTSTIKEIVNSYSGKSNSIMRKGWQRIFLNKEFSYLELTMFCIPASPSETNIKLEKRLGKNPPKVLMIAEQLNGRHYNDTISYLNSNSFSILRYTIDNKKGSSIWERFDSSNQSSKLASRAEEIVADIKNFIRINNLIY